MNRQWIAGLAGIVAILGGMAAAVEDASELTVFNIPKIDKHAIDANAEAWGNTGFRVDLLPDPSGNLRPASDFDPRFRLAWNDDGLLVLVTVRKPGIVEAAQLEDIWSKDSFEIFMAQQPGAP